MYLKLAGKDKDIVEFHMPQHAMAEFFGVTRPSFARALGEMADEGVVEVERRTVRILDRNRLVEMVR